jgi:hypothetical protein
MPIGVREGAGPGSGPRGEESEEPGGLTHWSSWPPGEKVTTGIIRQEALRGRFGFLPYVKSNASTVLSRGRGRSETPRSKVILPRGGHVRPLWRRYPLKCRAPSFAGSLPERPHIAEEIEDVGRADAQRHQREEIARLTTLLAAAEARIDDLTRELADTQAEFAAVRDQTEAATACTAADPVGARGH